MANVTVIGGHGKVALRLLPLLVADGHEVTAWVRNPQHVAEVAATGANVMEADVQQLNTEEMVQRQRFAVLGGPEGADAELSGTVVAFGATPVTFDQSGRATEYEIFLTAQIAFKRAGEDQPIWSNDRYTFRETYPIEATNQDYVDLEDDAIERAAERFAETMVSDLLEGF